MATKSIKFIGLFQLVAFGLSILINSKILNIDSHVQHFAIISDTSISTFLTFLFSLKRVFNVFHVWNQHFFNMIDITRRFSNGIDIERWPGIGPPTARTSRCAKDKRRKYNWHNYYRCIGAQCDVSWARGQSEMIRPTLIPRCLPYQGHYIA